MDWLAYHDRTSADHQAHFDNLFPKGWRMISLSVYGSRGDERYAAIWVKRAGPDWSAVHGIVGAGYRPTCRGIHSINVDSAANFTPVRPPGA
jgi:hypothetical protein